MILVSIVFVLAAAATLAAGLLNAGLGLIYVSIGCSLVAALFLVVAVLRGRPERAAAPTGATFSPAAASSVPAAPTAASTSSWAGSEVSTPSAPPAAGDRDWRPAAATAPAPVPADVAEAAPQAAGAALLTRLRRRGGSNGSPAVATPVAQADDGDTGTGTDRADSDDATSESFAPPAAVPTVGDAGEGGSSFPIPDYDELRATAIVTQLDGLDRSALEQVRSREVSGKNRFSVMSRLDTRLEALSPAEPAPGSVAASVSRRVTSKRLDTGTRVPASRSARKVPAKKVAAIAVPPVKATAKRSAATRSKATKSAATKSTATKSTTRKAAAKAVVPTALAGVAAATTVAATKAVSARKSSTRKAAPSSGVAASSPPATSAAARSAADKRVTKAVAKTAKRAPVKKAAPAKATSAAKAVPAKALRAKKALATRPAKKA